METSSIPNALDALFDMAKAETAAGKSLEGVFVSDGPLLQPPTAKRVLIIGGSDVGSDELAAEGEQSWVSIPGRERDETYSILCTALAWSGSNDVRSLRRDAFDVLGAVEALIRPPSGDVTLNGSVRWAGVTGPLNYSPIHTEKGAVCRVYFTIECRERLS